MCREQNQPKHLPSDLRLTHYNTFSVYKCPSSNLAEKKIK